MDLVQLQKFLITCAVINVGLLIYWFAFIAVAKDWVKRIHGKFFDLSDQTFDAIHYGGMAALKLFTVIFNIAPAIAIAFVK